jgi:putative tryptophan/tyrosine transport system substrate-binding protein
VTVEYRAAEDRYDRLPELAADLVRRQVAVIVTLGTPPALAAKAATQTIPVVFYLGVDPVEYGLVASLARPGGNMTGFTTITKELMAKRMELIHELTPAATPIAYLFNPTNISSETDDVQKAARALGVGVLMMEASRESDIEPAIEKMVQQRAGALVVSGDLMFFGHYSQIAALAARHAMLSIFTGREAVEQGGLMSYGVNDLDLHRQVGVYIPDAF